MTVVTGFALEGLDAFFGDDRDHNEGGDGIGPPPGEGGVQDTTDEKDA